MSACAKCGYYAAERDAGRAEIIKLTDKVLAQANALAGGAVDTLDKVALTRALGCFLNDDPIEWIQRLREERDAAVKDLDEWKTTVLNDMTAQGLERLKERDAARAERDEAVKDREALRESLKSALRSMRGPSDVEWSKVVGSTPRERSNTR